MMPGERRHIVKRIIVNHVHTTKETHKGSLDHISIKSYNDRKTKNKKQIARKLLREYLHDSSMHGVKYLGTLKIKSNVFVKLFWASIMILSFVFLTWMIGEFWKRYSANPTRTVVESFQAPIFLTPFPAVTLCPLVPPLVSRRAKLLERLRLPRNVDHQKAMFLLKYGPAFLKDHVPGGLQHMEDLKALLRINHIKLVEFVKLLRPCEDLIEACWWDGIEKNCSDLFKISHTSSGICCSFNYHLEDYIISNRTMKDSDFRRTVSFGPTSGLTIVLHRDLLVENDGTGNIVRFSTNSVGVLVFSHHPLEYISAVFARHILQAQQELRIAVTPLIKKKISGYYHRDSHGELNPHCADEKATLKYFPVYRYSNCFISCSVEIVFQTCGCLPYYYEPIATKYSLRMCDLEDVECLHANIDNMRIVEDMDTENLTCTCRNPCTNVYYATQTSACILNTEDFNPSPIYKNRTKAQAVLNVFLSSETFVITNTIPIADELYLLASMGGIFSLFVGCSFISAVEIAYFIGLFFRSFSKKSKKSK